MQIVASMRGLFSNRPVIYKAYLHVRSSRDTCCLAIPSFTVSIISWAKTLPEHRKDKTGSGRKSNSKIFFTTEGTDEAPGAKRQGGRTRAQLDHRRMRLLALEPQNDRFLWFDSRSAVTGNVFGGCSPGHYLATFPGKGFFSSVHKRGFSRRLTGNVFPFAQVFEEIGVYRFA